jgi:hypothetical protein
MALPLSSTGLKVYPRHLEKRTHNRVRVALLGRYMLANRQEFPCRTIDMSPGGMTLMAPVKGALDERVIVYLEQLGRLEGTITRFIDDGFCMTIHATPRKRDKLGDQLTWLANRHELGLPEDRCHERVVPRMQSTMLVTEDGREILVRIIDVSRSGVALSTDTCPLLNTPVTVGHTEGKVVRLFEGGIAVEFLRTIPEDSFSETVVL